MYILEESTQHDVHWVIGINGGNVYYPDQEHPIYLTLRMYPTREEQKEITKLLDMRKQ